MFDWNDRDAVFAYRQLKEAVLALNRPLCVWVGAGASKWCGYPTWEDLATIFDREFSHFERTYDRDAAKGFLATKDYPAVFSLCQRASPTRYNTLIVHHLRLRPPSPVFLRFIETLRTVRPVHVVTTNVDEAIEKHLPTATTIFRSDIERLPSLLIGGQDFVGKIHGTIGEVSSLVFTSEEYGRLCADEAFQNSLRQVLQMSTVLFIGYGLRDDYVLRLLERNSSEKPLFGDGPHFAVLNEGPWSLPPNVRRIRYLTDIHKDHLSPIRVLEEVSRLRGAPPPQPPVRQIITATSGHLLMEIYPAGRRSTATHLEVTHSDGRKRQIVIGDGFTDQEIPDNRSSAMHDILVGLLCFDKIFAPVWATQALHGLLGADLFWHLADSDVLRLIHWTWDAGLVFPSAESASQGSLGVFMAKHPDGASKTSGEILRRQIIPVPGKEAEAEEKLASLESRIIQVDDDAVGQVANTTRSLLLRSSVRRALAMSEGTPMESIARWQAFPVLRLSALARMAGTCAHLGIPSARINFGAAALSGPAFSLANGPELADDAAGYVVAGAFATNLGALAERDPAVVRGIVAFRDTEAGVRLRREVLDRLAVNAGQDAVVAINGGLRQAVPSRVLQEARDQMTKLYVRPSKDQSRSPAFWNDTSLSEKALKLWRKRSRSILLEHIQANRIDPYVPCPCGSSEQLKFCCLKATEIV